MLRGLSMCKGVYLCAEGFIDMARNSERVEVGSIYNFLSIFGQKIFLASRRHFSHFEWVDKKGVIDVPKGGYQCA